MKTITNRFCLWLVISICPSTVSGGFHRGGPVLEILKAKQRPATQMAPTTPALERITPMNPDKLQFNRFVAAPCRSLIRRRSQRGWWAYILWLPFYVLFAVFLAQLTGNSLWALVVPVIALLVVQWIYPTLLGWAVFFLPTVFCAGVGALAVIWTNIGSQARWKADWAGTLLSASFEVVLGVVCVALFVARPRKGDKANETCEPVTPPF